MEKNRTTTFSVYLMIILFLISTFITMVITEANIIRVPCRAGYIEVNGVCREVFTG
uniref:U17-MYRTX-Tb1d n=1 Tax=Tetramorium bicarinatum TaxID=219812 RepID=A0A6M6RIV0_TETBN|nr:U17-MYRTX-Tb1d precursor [Tetramorium bicarinatum]